MIRLFGLAALVAVSEVMSRKRAFVILVLMTVAIAAAPKVSSLAFATVAIALPGLGLAAIRAPALRSNLAKLLPKLGLAVLVRLWQTTVLAIILIALGELVGLRPRKQARRERALLELAASLLPKAERERYASEWLDHLECAAQAGIETRVVVRSLLLRSVIPLLVEIWAARLRRAAVRG